MSQVNQVEFQLAFLMARLSVLVTEQSRAYVYAFQMEAPTHEIWETSVNQYLALDAEIRNCMSELYLLKDSYK